MIDFFFDTADIDYINGVWQKTKEQVNATHVRGITTNPNAFHKLSMHSLSSWEQHLPRLCETVSNIRNDGEGVVYVQAPNSNMTGREVLDFAKYIHTRNDGNTKLALKIPPFLPILKFVDQINEYMEVNVTGVSDCSTALCCFSYPVRYVSLIPGRMEEKGLDAKSHIDYTNQRKASRSSIFSSKERCQEIITGSMRTLEGLRWVSECGTVPTIGQRVWDLIMQDNNLSEFASFNSVQPTNWNKFSPHVTDTSTQLSVDFFEQMDSCGKKCWEDYKETVK